MEDYFVGRRQIPWWAVLGSLVATEISAATYLAVPGVGFSENMTYLQFGLGSFLGFYWTTASGIERWNKELFRNQALTMTELTGVLMTADLDNIKPIANGD